LSLYCSGGADLNYRPWCYEPKGLNLLLHVVRECLFLIEMCEWSLTCGRKFDYTSIQFNPWLSKWAVHWRRARRGRRSLFSCRGRSKSRGGWSSSTRRWPQTSRASPSATYCTRSSSMKHIDIEWANRMLRTSGCRRTRW